MTLKHFLWYQLPLKTETIAENISLTRTTVEITFYSWANFSVYEHKISHQGEPIRC